MIRSVLYMGGMAGDLVVALLAPNQIELITNRMRIYDQFCRLKSFHKMSQEEKLNYYQTQQGILSSHDTAFHKKFPQETVRLYCKNLDTARWMSNRFWEILTETRKHQLIKELRLHGNPAEGYAHMIRDWSNSHPFPHQLDMSNVRNYKFIQDFLDFCRRINYTVNEDAVRQLYHDWHEHMVNK